MKEIPLYRRDGSIRAYTIVDAEDFAALAGERWHMGSGGYARRNEDGRAILMHRILLDAPMGLEVDHINRDRLDNRRANLRIVTRAEQMQNRNPHRGSTSVFRGVAWHNPRAGGRRGSWAAKVQLDGVVYRLGRFQNELDAARAVEAWRREHMPFAEPDPRLEIAA